MPPSTDRLGPIAATVLLLAGALLIRPFGDFRDPAVLPPFLAGAMVMSLAFLLALRFPPTRNFWFWAPPIAARLVLLTMAPGDDIYRYIWEGRIQLSGFSPYCLAPDHPALAPLRDNFIWPQVGHPSVTAIYPPLTELFFRAVAALSPSVFAMKAAITAFDLLACSLLYRQFGAGATLYIWNPLVIYSFAGGGHYDSLFILSLAAAFHLWERGDSARNRLLACLALGAGVALKWLSLPLLLWALCRTLRIDGPRRSALATLAAATPFAVSFPLVANGHWLCPLAPPAFAHSARSAEALPALLGSFLPDRHPLDSNVAYLLLFLALAFFLLRRLRDIRPAAYASFAAALLTTPMFHAWYATWLLPAAAGLRPGAPAVLCISSFVYFWLHVHIAAPGGEWRQSPLEKALLWGPFLAALLWDHLRERRRNR